MFQIGDQLFILLLRLLNSIPQYFHLRGRIFAIISLELDFLAVELFIKDSFPISQPLALTIPAALHQRGGFRLFIKSFCLGSEFCLRLTQLPLFFEQAARALCLLQILPALDIKLAL